MARPSTAPSLPHELRKDLDRAEARFHHLVEATGDVIWITECDPERVVRSLGGTRHASAQGEVEIDADTNHTALKARIGRSREDGGFDLLWEDASIVRPDPYLVAYERKIL